MIQRKPTSKSEKPTILLGQFHRTHRDVLGGVTAASREYGWQLLTSSDLSVAEIASLSGFQTRTYLYRAFRQATGLTPGQYRLRWGSSV